MTPAYEGDPAAPKVVPLDQWNTALRKQATIPSADQSKNPSE